MAIPVEHIAMNHHLRIRGLVQGVGFRPMVWRVANDLGLDGQVRNDGEGVAIALRASQGQLQAFIGALRDHCPPLARIDRIEHELSPDAIDQTGFYIAESRDGNIRTGIVPDAAICPDCLRELNDPADRRYRYPFINCTHCGPRLSIVRKIPYDRVNTGMAGFDLCDACAGEYEDPADRRFHAQPTACPECGPKVWLSDGMGNELPCDDAIVTAAEHIQQGAIVAIKGIGGFHLACDATHADAVAELRHRKHRPHKPLALIARDLDQLHGYCRVDAAEVAALTGPAAPIVILDALDIDRLPAAIAPGQQQWGFMLPYSPLHHLLMAELDAPLVLTSGNRSDEPQCIDNDDALARLADIADLFLLHDRPIEHRIDDSVMRRLGADMQLLRRARGFAPGQLPLPPGFGGHPDLLALGGELKNTLCLLKDGQAILSQHLGDLEDARTYDDYCHAIDLYLALYDHQPELLAVDAHPEYLSSKLGQEWSARDALDLIEVQHHHAHIAACMADNGVGLDEGLVLGIALDGLGLGDDGTLWGGEFLLADYLGYQRLAHLKPVALPGGGQAMREPWRNMAAQLVAAGSAPDGLAPLQDKPVAAITQMIAKGINSPMSSSAGRLFDAVAAAAGVAPDRLSFEGQAAMALEALVRDEGLCPSGCAAPTGDRESSDPTCRRRAPAPNEAAETPATEPYPFAIIEHSDRLMLDPAPCWQALLADIAQDTATDVIAARFHRGFAQALIETATRLAKEHDLTRIALSGGVFQNRSLFELVEHGLRKQGLLVLTHQQVPANDGGLALGQAVIAAARFLKERN